MVSPIALSHRPLIMGRRGAVASNHPAATQAGLDILRAGGHAVDATVAISLALGVAEPCMSGLGGDGFYHVWMAETATSTVFNGTGAAPLAATPERFAKSGIAIEGPLSTSIPGGVGGLYAMHDAHGGLPWARLAKPALGLAREGFLATHTYRHYAGLSLNKLRADAISRTVFLHDGEVPALGDAILQPDLAETLEVIASEGAEGFYRGPLSERLAHAMSSVGGMVTGTDLAGFDPEIQAPIATGYRGYEVRQTAPNSTGFVLLQELKIVERFDLASLEFGSAELIHLLVEAKKRAFVDRERHGTDPRYADIPIERLLSDEYTSELAASIDPDHAADMPLADPRHCRGDTTYFCVIDEAGNVVSAIQSLNSAFGSGVTAGRTGVLLNNRMAYWHLGQDHANALSPGKRVRHTMNAPMVFRDNRPWAVFGTPGADNQVQVNLQVLVAMIDFGLDPQQALEAPRWTSNQAGQGANWPHEGDGTLSIEEGLPEETLNALQARGHDLRALPYLGGPCSVACIRVLENGTRMAGSDPRRDGWAGAY